MVPITFEQFQSLDLEALKFHKDYTAKVGDIVTGHSLGDGWDCGKVIKVLGKTVHVEFGGELDGVYSLPKNWSGFGPMKGMWQFMIYPVPTTVPASKKDAARTLFDCADKTQSKHATAVMIANELNITVSNAAYYVACFTGTR